MRDVTELLAWRLEYARAKSISQMKAVALKFKVQLDAPALQNWQIHELLRGNDFDVVAGLLRLATPEREAGNLTIA